jgi:AcrR family transcriptional regulator
MLASEVDTRLRVPRPACDTFRMRRRARNEDDKRERRAALVAAALATFDETSYEAVTMTSVAERAGLAKGTLYLYFGTKEDLFLSVVEDRLGDWFEALDGWLANSAAPVGPDELSDFVAASLSSRTALVRLLAILHTTLERNVEQARVRDFMRFLLAHMTTTATLLERRVPALRPGDGARFLLRLDALVIGLWHLADPASPVCAVCEEPGMEPFAVDFATELAAMVRALLAR